MVNNHLVGGLEHGFYFPNSWDDDPIRRTHIFQGGRSTNQLVFHDDCIQAPRNPRVSKRNSELGTKLNWVAQVFSSLDMALQVAVSQVIKTGNGKC